MMKPIKRLSVILIIAAGSFQTSAQTLDSNAEAYRAYLKRSADEATEAWGVLVNSAASQGTGEDARFNLALAHFGLLNATMRSKNETLFKKHVDSAIANLKVIKGTHEYEARALRGAVYGLQLAYDPMKGMTLGPRSASLLAEARKGDPQSPLVWKLYGNSMLHTPEAYGGDVDEAIVAYERAISLYEAAPASTKENWLFLDTLAFLGQAYQKDGQKSKAIATYEKALAIEPTFDWVRYNLLPAAQNSSSQR